MQLSRDEAGRRKRKVADENLESGVAGEKSQQLGENGRLVDCESES